MFPGQRVSRRNQEIESIAMDTAEQGGGYDDFGLPSRPASGASKSRSSKLLGRFKKQGNASTPNVAAHMDGDSDDDDVSYTPQGSVPPAGPPSAPSPLYQPQGQPHPGQFQGQPQFQQFAPPPLMDDQHLPNPRAAPNSGAASPNSQGEISMDQLSSLRDRHRYPGFENDPKNGRAMSLNSMSAYDTTPVIPMLGPVTNFQSGSTHNRATPQEKYRQRMIESRRALLSSETAIPMSGSMTPSRPQVPQDQYLANLAGVPNMSGTPRSMSLSSSALSGPGVPGGPPVNGSSPAGMLPDGSRSMTMMSGPPAPMRGPPGPGPGPGGVPMYYNGPYGPSPLGGAPPPGAPYSPQGGPMPRSQSRPNVAWNGGMYANYPPQHMYANAPPGGPGGRAPPGGPPAPHPYYAGDRSGPEPQNGAAQDDAAADAFDFGTEYPSAQNTVQTQTQNPVDSRKIEELNELLNERENEIRVLSIELAESARRELHLAPVHDGKAQEQAAALAKAHDDLVLERARRTAVEKSTTNPDATVHERLAEMDHRHSEAVHLLATRTDQYELLQQKHASLSTDYEQQLKDYKETSARLKQLDMRQRTHQEDQLLTQQVQTLEAENAKLRKQLDESAPQGRLGERVVDLEEQRKALQETLRTMRERKDSEINALRSRVEQLQQQVQQQHQQRGRLASAGSSTSTVPGTAGSTAEGPSPLYRPTPVRVMSRQPSNESALGPGDETLSLNVPRIRDSGPARPATPLHLRINYEKHEAV